MFGKRQGPDVIPIDAHRKRPAIRPLGELAGSESSDALMHAAMLGTEDQYRPDIVQGVAHETLDRAE